MASDPKAQQPDEFSGEIDPDVAELLGTGSSGGDGAVPDFQDLFGSSGGVELEAADEGDPESSIGSQGDGFVRAEHLQGEPQPYFKNKNFYKEILTGEGEVSNRVHQLLGGFLNAKDSQDRSMYRNKLIPAHWELARSVAAKIGPSLSTPKRVFLRFAVLVPTILSPEQRDLIARVIPENRTGEPIYYVDEWLGAVAAGRVNASATDETKKAGKNSAPRINAMLEKARGRYEAQLSVVNRQADAMRHAEQGIKDQLKSLERVHTRDDLDGIRMPYDDSQKAALTEIGNLLRKLNTLNRDLERHTRELESAREQRDELEQKEAEEGGAPAVDTKVVVEELNTVRQMAKISIGRQGNHFPVLTKQYFRGGLYDLGCRENVLNMLAEVEYYDPGLFLRTFKMQTNRIVPNVVLVPCYGELGICWEPFERFNRASSRGRLAIPMYPKDLKTAVVAALGDLRWQVAKEKAQHYWMEEGLTGWYYQWFADRKMRGDVKDAFIQDYILWITKETEGTQKLDREVRDIFWRYMPFPQEVKDSLKNRGYVYNELYRKDANRAMSDGY